MILVFIIEKMDKSAAIRNPSRFWRGCGEEEGANPMVALLRQEMELLH